MKTSELTGTALDWAVAIAMGWTDVQITGFEQEGMREHPFFRPAKYFGQYHICGSGQQFQPSTDWEQGGMLIDHLQPQFIDRASMLDAWDILGDGVPPRGIKTWWLACAPGPRVTKGGYGETHLIAMCRWLVRSRIGDNIEVPEGLC